MPDANEKSGLARSIDALFSQSARAPEATPPEPAATPIEPDPIEPDPFESLDALTGPSTVVDADPVPEPATSLPEIEVFQEAEAAEVEAVEVEAVEVEAAAVDAEVEVVEVEFEPLDAPGDGEGADEGVVDFAPVDLAPVDDVPAPIAVTTPQEADSPEDDLAEAVDAFLRGDAGAAEDIRAISATLRDRMALDPLADAVERLGRGEGPGLAEDPVALALEVINPAVASRLVQRMGHADEDEVRASYVELSQRLGLVMAKAFRGALTDSTDPRARRAYYDAMIAMGETSRPLIEEMMEDDNRFLVRNAVAILGEIGGEWAVGLVTSALANTDARVRREALNSLAKLGGEESGQLVMGFLEDPQAEVRAAAAEAAGALGVERALRPILGLLEGESDPEILVPILRGLGRLGDPGAVQAIEKRAVGSMFSKPPTEVRVAAYRALHEIGTPHARRLIEQASEDKDAVVRTTARGLVAAE